MKKFYNEPIMAISVFDSADVVTTSGIQGEERNGSGWDAGVVKSGDAVSRMVISNDTMSGILGFN